MTDQTDFIRAKTAISAPALVPEIKLHLATEVAPLWRATQSTLETDNLPPPYWAFAWPGGQALARYILDHPQIVRGRRVLDCCGGLGYFAHWCLVDQAASILSFEKSEAVLWLRAVNPWSPRRDARLKLQHGDVTEEIGKLPARSFGSILHDPPRFGIAGELYSQTFYGELERVLDTNGILFHYTGSPNSKSRGRDMQKEVKKRLAKAGLAAEIAGDGLVARRSSRRVKR